MFSTWMFDLNWLCLAVYPDIHSPQPQPDSDWSRCLPFWCQEADARKQVPGSRCQETGARKQVAGSRWQEADGRKQVAGSRWQEAPSFLPSAIWYPPRKDVCFQIDICYQAQVQVQTPLPKIPESSLPFDGSFLCQIHFKFSLSLFIWLTLP